MVEPSIYITPIVVMVLLILVMASMRILREYGRAVVFTPGRFEKVKGPGMVLLIPFIQQMVRVRETA